MKIGVEVDFSDENLGICFECIYEELKCCYRVVIYCIREGENLMIDDKMMIVDG